MVGLIYIFDIIMRLVEFLQCLVIFGGGFIVVEFVYIFFGFGFQVIVINCFGWMLCYEDCDILQCFIEQMGCWVCLWMVEGLVGVDCDFGGYLVVLIVDGDGVDYDYLVDVVFNVVGWVFNGDCFNLLVVGVDVDDDGFVVVDKYQCINVEYIWVLGDVCFFWEFKYVVNYEVCVVCYNLLYFDDLVSFNYCFVLYVVFLNLQVVLVGVMEQELL